MSESENVFKKIGDKLQSVWKIKHIKIVAGIIILAIALLFVANVSEDAEKASGTMSDEEYVAALEKRLEKILSEVDGVGDVQVLITCKGTSEIVPATESESKYTEKSDSSYGGNYVDKTETANSSPVMSSGSPIILGKTYPEISGVLIVAEGAKDISVRLKLLQAASTALAVDPSIIAVLSKGK